MAKAWGGLIPFFLVISSLYGQTEMAGPLTREEILNQCGDWQAVVSDYVPKSDIIDRLKAYPRDVQVEVFLGTWCPDSKAHVGEYFKVLDEAANPLIRTTYMGMPKDKMKRAPYDQGRDIRKLPTFVVFLESREIGRIIEAPEKSIEEDLLDILEKFL